MASKQNLLLLKLVKEKLIQLMKYGQENYEKLCIIPTVLCGKVISTQIDIWATATNCTARFAYHQSTLAHSCISSHAALFLALPTMKSTLIL